MNRRSVADTLPTLILGAALVVFFLHALNYLYFFIDDEGIPFVYAQNVLNGHGLVYNPQDGPVEGYSDFAHVWLATAILAAARALGVNKLAVFFVGKTLSLAFGLGTVWLTARFLDRLHVTSSPAVLAGLGFVALGGPLAVWSSSSLETVPFVFLMLVLAYALSDESGSGRSDRLAAVAAIGLVLERIDGFVYAGAIVAAFSLCLVPDRRHVILRRVVAPLVVAAAAYHVWRLEHFHAIVPASVAAKLLYRLQWRKTLVVRQPDQGYAIRFFNLFVWTPAIATVSTIALAINRDRRAVALALVTLLLTAYVGIVGDWMFGFRFFAGLIPLFGIMCAWSVARFSAWNKTAGWALAVCALLAVGQSAYALERSYETEEKRPSWLAHPREGLATYFAPLYDTQRMLCALAKPGDTMACNWAGFVPFMAGIPNIDNLGLCTRFFDDLPTTDVIFTEVGRYSPMTSRPVLRAADAYLMYRAPTFILEPRRSLQYANHGWVPAELFGGRYRLLESDPSNVHEVYVQARSVEEFRERPDLFLENLAHVSSIVSLRVDGRLVPPSTLFAEHRYLREDQDRLSFNGSLDIDIRLALKEESVYEFYIHDLATSSPISVTLALSSTGSPGYHETRDVVPGKPLRWLVRLPQPVRATHASLLFSTTSGGPATVSLTDVRVQGQSPRLAEFIARRLVLGPQ